MVTLFQVSGSPLWPGLSQSTSQFQRNAIWEEQWDVQSSFSVPPTIILKDDSQDFRSRFLEAAFQPASIPVSSKPTKRTVVISGDVFRDSSAELDTLRRQLQLAASRPHLKLKIDNEKYINLASCKSFDWVWRKASGRTYAQCRITWEASDMFWYRLQRQSFTRSMQLESYLFTVSTDSNIGSWPTSPEFRFTTSAGQDLGAGFTLTHDTDEQAALSYADPYLKEGAQLKINCEESTLRRDGENSIRWFSGEFLRLLPGDNQLHWSGPPCEFSAYWRERWL